MKKNTVFTWIFMIVLAAAIIFGFIRVSNKKNEKNIETDGEQTEADKLLEKDILASYPATPREVIKLYSRFLKCFYNEEIEEGQLEGLAAQIRLLFDDELLEENPKETYLLALEAEIAEYKLNKRTLLSYQIEKASSAIEWSDEGSEYTRLIAYYSLKESLVYKVHEEFVLRKDKADRWKILGWRLVDKEEMETN